MQEGKKMSIAVGFKRQCHEKKPLFSYILGVLVYTVARTTQNEAVEKCRSWNESPLLVPEHFAPCPY
jgi:hypothetical protein